MERERAQYAAALRLAREASGLSQDDVAERVGVTRASVSYYEQGQTEIGALMAPSLPVHEKLAALFPDLPPTPSTVARRGVSTNRGNWHGAAPSRPCPRGPLGAHAFWYAKNGSLRVCELCPLVERRPAVAA